LDDLTPRGRTYRGPHARAPGRDLHPCGGLGAPAPGDLARAAAQASASGAAVRFLGGILVPEEETCFWLYRAPAAEAVRAAMTAAGLRPERITPAETLRPPRPARRRRARSRPATPRSNALTDARAERWLLAHSVLTMACC